MAQQLRIDTVRHCSTQFCHFFFCADLVAFTSPSFFSTFLMMPTATVCRMSLTANRPSGAYLEKGSTHIGLDGTIFTILGDSSRTLLLRRSIFCKRVSNLHATWAV